MRHSFRLPRSRSCRSACPEPVEGSALFFRLFESPNQTHPAHQGAPKCAKICQGAPSFFCQIIKTKPSPPSHYRRSSVPHPWRNSNPIKATKTASPLPKRTLALSKSAPHRQTNPAHEGATSYAGAICSMRSSRPGQTEQSNGDEDHPDDRQPAAAVGASEGHPAGQAADDENQADDDIDDSAHEPERSNEGNRGPMNFLIKGTTRRLTDVDRTQPFAPAGFGGRGNKIQPAAF